MKTESFSFYSELFSMFNWWKQLLWLSKPLFLFTYIYLTSTVTDFFSISTIVNSTNESREISNTVLIYKHLHCLLGINFIISNNGALTDPRYINNKSLQVESIKFSLIDKRNINCSDLLSASRISRLNAHHIRIYDSGVSPLSEFISDFRFQISDGPLETNVVRVRDHGEEKNWASWHIFSVLFL